MSRVPYLSGCGEAMSAGEDECQKFTWVAHTRWAEMFRPCRAKASSSAVLRVAYGTPVRPRLDLVGVVAKGPVVVDAVDLGRRFFGKALCRPALPP